MADGIDGLFVFGEDFEAILDLLEEDEATEEQFITAVDDVSTKHSNYSSYFRFNAY